MARYWFGKSPADWTFTTGSGDTVVLAGGVAVTFWNAESGGTQYTDLLDASGTPITQVITGDGTTLPTGVIPQFQGPDNVAVLWADAGGGTRYRLVGDLSGLPAQVDALSGEVDGVSAAVDALATVAATGEYDDLINKPTLAPVATSGAYSDLSGAPAPGLQIVTKTGGTWPVRSSTAPDTSRLAAWVGPAPAPPVDAGYALPGDLWWPTP